MKKNIRLVCMILIATLLIMGYATAYATTTIKTTLSEDYIPSEITITIDDADTQFEVSTIEEAQQLMAVYKNDMKSAKKMKSSSEELGYFEIARIADIEYQQAEDNYKYYSNIYNQLIWQKKAQQYPAAATIWEFFENQGYNQYIIAGILGNLMAETGSQTLNIKYWENSNGYYGMAQWSVLYYPRVVGLDLEGQCKFLQNNIKTIIDKYGYKYKTGFNYNAFLQLTDEKAAAKAFAVCYERCDPKYYHIRTINATRAYDYFVN